MSGYISYITLKFLLLIIYNLIEIKLFEGNNSDNSWVDANKNENIFKHLRMYWLEKTYRHLFGGYYTY